MAKKTTQIESSPVSVELVPVNPAGNLSGESAVETLAVLKIGKSEISLEILNRAIHAAQCAAGRIASKARETGHGRLIKDMTGGGTLIPTLAVLKDMQAAGLLGETNSKEGKQLVQGQIDQVRGLNLIVDGLALLGIHKRS